MYYFAYYVYDFWIMQQFTFLVRRLKCLLQLEIQEVDWWGPSLIQTQAAGNDESDDPGGWNPGGAGRKRVEDFTNIPW